MRFQSNSVSALQTIQTLLGIPPPVTSGGTQYYTDPLGDIWVANPGIYGGSWNRAEDVLWARVYRSVTYTTPAGGAQNFPYDTVNRDPFGIVALPGITLPLIGLWSCFAAIQVANANGRQYMYIASQLIFDYNNQNFNASTTMAGAVEAMSNGASTCYVLFSTAVAGAVTLTNTATWLQVRFIGPG